MPLVVGTAVSDGKLPAQPTIFASHLEAGEQYSFEVLMGNRPFVSLTTFEWIDPSGQTVATDLDGGACSLRASGMEIVAAQTGTYYLVVDDLRCVIVRKRRG